MPARDVFRPWREEHELLSPPRPLLKQNTTDQAVSDQECIPYVAQMSRTTFFDGIIVDPAPGAAR